MSRLRTDEDGNMIFRVTHGGSREQSRHKHENQTTSGARLGDQDKTRSMRGEIALRTRASLALIQALWQCFMVAKHVCLVLVDTQELGVLPFSVAPGTSSTRTASSFSSVVAVAAASRLRAKVPPMRCRSPHSPRPRESQNPMRDSRTNLSRSGSLS